MKSVSVRSQPVTVSSRSVSRILVIEPDAAQAEILQDLLLARLEIDLVVVKRVEDALRFITDEIPDLVLTSAFLPPADEAVLAAQFRKMPAASHVQIVNLPYFLGTDIESPDHSSRSKVMGFFARRAATLRPACDADTLNRQIEDYLHQAVTLRAERRDDVPDYVVRAAAEDVRVVAGPEATAGDARLNRYARRAARGATEDRPSPRSPPCTEAQGHRRAVVVDHPAAVGRCGQDR